MAGPDSEHRVDHGSYERELVDRALAELRSWPPDRPSGPAATELVHYLEVQIRPDIARRLRASGLLSREDVLDVAQQVVAELLVNDAACLRRWDPDMDCGASLRGYARKIAENRATDWRRSTGRHNRRRAALRQHLEAIAPSWPSPEQMAAAGVRHEAFKAFLLERMGPIASRIYELRIEQDLPIVDVAANVGRTRNSIDNWIFRIRRRLEEYLDIHRSGPGR